MVFFTKPRSLDPTRLGVWRSMDLDHVVVFCLYDTGLEKKSRKTKRINLRSSFTIEYWLESCFFSITLGIRRISYFTRVVWCYSAHPTEKFWVEKLELCSDLTILYLALYSHFFELVRIIVQLISLSISV